MRPRSKWQLKSPLLLLLLLNLTFTVVMASEALDTPNMACKSNPCMYGICVDEANSSYRCYCIDGYTGINCEINWDDCWSEPCLNGGTCRDAVASYNCTCPEGFVGVNCEQRYSQCMSQPCLNNGICSDQDGKVSCRCLEGFSGEFCQVDASVCNSSVCRNGAECVEGPGLSFECRCAEGWTGRFCELDLDECVEPEAVCRNGALCINLPGSFQCACLFGFTGRRCERPVLACPRNPCHNDAVCLLEDTDEVCYCVPDFHGPLCELRYDDCAAASARCQNGGSCVDGLNGFSCSCPPPYAGDSCAATEPPPLPEARTEYEAVTEQRPTDADYDESLSSGYPSTLSSGVNEVTTSAALERGSSEASTIATTIAIEPGSSANPTTTTTSEHGSSFSESSTSTTTFERGSTSSESPTIVPTIERGSTEFPTITTTVERGSSESTTIVTKVESGSSEFPTVTTKVESGSSESPTIATTVERGSTESSTIHTTIERGSSESPAITSALEHVSITPESSTIASTLVVTMLPSSVASDNAAATTFLMTESSVWPPASLRPGEDETTSTASSDEFTSVSDFHRSTFGSDIETSTVPITTEQTQVPLTSRPVHACTIDQCANTTRCLQNSSQCDCSYRDNCRWPQGVSSAAFNGNSYIRQKFAIESGSLSVMLRLKTKANSGILVHALFDDERYVLLYMESGQLKFQFSCGLQTMLFGELDSPVNNGHEVDIEMRFRYNVEEASDRCSAQLLVNGSLAMSGEQLLQTHESVPRFARLHLGGIPVAFSRQFPQIVLGFVGCMNLLKVNGIERDFIRDSVEAVQIEECRSFLCLSNPCKNFGACKEVDGSIQCKCIAGYSGEFCERSTCDSEPCHLGATCLVSPGANFVCVCPLGAHGLYCEKDTTIVQPSFSVFAPGFSSYMAYGLSSSLKDSMELKMRISPQNLEQISLLAYVGQSGGPKRQSSDHLSVTYVRGYLMLTWDLGSGVRRIFTSSPVDTRARKVHTVRVGRRGRDSWLHVEGVGNVTGHAAGTNTRLDVSPILYIGGHKSKYFDTLPHDLPLHTGFSGCIYDVELRTDDSVFPVTMASPATGRGVGECHRNECSHHSCKNGAVCLNYGPTYSCVCMKDWQGPDCSHPINCTSSDSQC